MAIEYLEFIHWKGDTAKFKRVGYWDWQLSDFTGRLILAITDKDKEAMKNKQ